MTEEASPPTTPPTTPPANSPDRWTYFIVDTETTGFKKVCAADPLNKAIQIFCRRLQEDTDDAPDAPVFNELMHPGHHIPKESTGFHRITDADVVGKPSTHDVMISFKEWVEEHTLPGTRPMLVAHNAPFDRMMVYKGIGGEIAGRDGEHLDWVWFDTLVWARKYLPELGDAVWPFECPYKLENLLKGMNLGDAIQGAHNAKADVDALQAVFVSVLPKIGPLLQGQDWKTAVGCVWPNDPKRFTRTRRLIDVSGIGPYRCKLIAEELSGVFRQEQEDTWRRWQANPNMITLAHLMAFGTLRSKDDPSWWNVCNQVEVMLREKLLIWDDDTISHIISALCGVSEMDLWEHTMRDDGNKRFFPTCWGTPLGFIPFRFSVEAAERVARKMKAGTASSLYMQYMYCGGEAGRRAWAKRFGRESGLGFREIQVGFDKLHRFNIVKNGR